MNLKTPVIIVVMLVLGMLVPGIPMGYAADESPVLQACEPYALTLEGIDLEELKKDGIGDSEFRSGLAKGANAYHQYIQCLFDEATNIIIPDFVRERGAKKPPTPACLPQEEFAKKARDTSPEILLKPILAARENYGIFLNEMLEAYKAHRNEMVGPSQAINNIRWFRDHINREIQSATIALDTAFIQLKELRSAYTLHVHFSCMAENLSNYRQMVAKIRSQLLDMEPRLESASMMCPAK